MQLISNKCTGNNNILWRVIYVHLLTYKNSFYAKIVFSVKCNEYYKTFLFYVDLSYDLNYITYNFLFNCVISNCRFYARL